MIKRHTIAALALAGLTAAATLSSAPAAAHHTGTGICDEIGIWTPSDRARTGARTKEHMVDARVSYTPAAANCHDGWSTQWWARTSTNYNQMDIKNPPNNQSRTTLLDHLGYVVDGQTDYINSRTRGRIVPPVQESINLYVTTDGGVKVWFNGGTTPVIDEWHDHASPTTYHYVTPVLSPTQEYPIIIEYFHKTGQQKLQLHWKTTPTNIALVPSTAYNGYSSQASALHARADDGKCTETVATRTPDGELRIMGYGCGTPETQDSDPEYLSLGTYTKDWVTLFQRWNGADNPNTWSHWVKSWDTGQWLFVGNTGPRPEEQYGWLESSGYNESVPHQTTFENYREGTTYVDFTVCPEAIDADTHQAMDPYYGGVGAARFYPASDAQDTC